jgi:hypothetical protein
MDLGGTVATLATGAVGGALLSWVRDLYVEWRRDGAQKVASDQKFRAAIRLVRAEVAANAATLRHVKETGTNLPEGKEIPTSSVQFRAAQEILAQRLSYEDWVKVSTPYFRLDAKDVVLMLHQPGRVDLITSGVEAFLDEAREATNALGEADSRLATKG